MLPDLTKMVKRFGEIVRAKVFVDGQPLTFTDVHECLNVSRNENLIRGIFTYH